MDDDREDEPAEPATEGDAEWRERTQAQTPDPAQLPGPPVPPGDEEGMAQP